MRSLLTPQGWGLLQSLPPYDEGSAMALGQSLRAQGHDPALVAAALTQARLRLRGRDKLGSFAEAMVFTPDGLEQATRLSVAAHHARRYVGAGCTRVVDLGCGLGSDAMAFAALDRQVLAVDCDELTAALAAVNLRHWPGAVVRCADVTTLDLDAEIGVGEGVWLDPARRTSRGARSRRTFDPESFSPPYSFVLDVLRRFPASGAKLAPGLAHHLLPPDTEAQWVSFGGDVVECALWSGTLAREGVSRSALLLNGSGATHELIGDPSAERGPVRPVGGFLHEPDGAVIRAGLVADLAARLGAHPIDPTIAYLSSDRPVESPFVRSYAVQDVLAFNLKALRTHLRDRGVGRVTIKKRGSAVDPDVLRRQLRLSGSGEATIVLTRVAGQPSVLLVRPLP